MSKYERDFLDLGQDILDNGEWVHNERTGIRCKTLIGRVLRIDVGKGEVPLLTTKQSFPVSAVAEIIGYLRAYTNAQQFEDIGSKTWWGNANETQAWLDNPNRKGSGDMGKVYGAVARDFGGLDLVYKVYNNLMDHIDDRGETISFWKPDEFKLGCLRPCMRNHTFSILNGTLHMTSESRSVDYGCGLNFNSIQCYFLLKAMAKMCNLKAGISSHYLINVHIYEPHIENVKVQLSRTPMEMNAQINIKDSLVSLEDLLGNDKHARDFVEIVGYDKTAHQGKLEFELIA